MTKKTSLRPSFDWLEDRTVPATFGVPWPDPMHLTMSLVPDGTAIAAHSSNLEATLDAAMPRQVWQETLVRAFQTWAKKANVNVGVVADQGWAFGTAGLTQGDPRFGDIRIGAHAMAADVYSISVPHDPFISGTLAGDIFFNSEVSYDPDRLMAIALHEAGHALGLPHSNNPTSVMFSHFNNRTTLSASDVLAIRKLYGRRAPDVHEGKKGNDRIRFATRIKYSQSSDGYTGAEPLVLFGDITKRRDVDYYWVKPLDGYTGAITFRVQTAGLSPLLAKVTVTDEDGNLLASGETTDPLGDDLRLTLPSVDPGLKYYVRVESSGSRDFGVGRYALITTFDDNLQTTEEEIQRVVRGPYDNLRSDEILDIFEDPTSALFAVDPHTNDTFLTAERLKTVPGYPRFSRYDMLASLHDAVDVDMYIVKPPKKKKPVVMTVSLQAAPVNGIVPELTVFDRNMAPVDVDVLVNGNGTYTFQVPNVRRKDRFFFRLQGAQNGTTTETGNYRLTVSYGKRAAQLPTIAEGAVDPNLGQTTYQLYVGQSQLFHFLLSNPGMSALAAAGDVTMELRDKDGNVVHTLQAAPGEEVSGGSVFLAPGAYTVTFTGSGGATPGASAPLYRLRAASIGGPIGPVVDDPTLLPQYQCPHQPDLFCYPDGTETPNPYLLILLTL